MQEAVAHSDLEAAGKFLPVIYDELRKLAASKLASQPPGQTLQPTALVHEAWLRLASYEGARFANKAHFFAAAAQAMRCILIDNARRKQSRKHGGGWERVDGELFQLAEPLPSDDLLALDEALKELEQLDPQAAQLVQLRFFVGLTQRQTAEIVGLSPRNADRTWAHARAWLFQRITGQEKPPG
jgi:RNA polymerase sigma factor (TIGR02999 family)